MKNKIWQKYLITLVATVLLVGVAINVVGRIYVTRKYTQKPADSPLKTEAG